MEWHKRLTPYQWSATRRVVQPKETEAAFIARMAPHAGQMKPDYEALSRWVIDRKPYYNVWPSMAEGLSRVRLDVPCKAIFPLLSKMPAGISVRFPVGREIPVPDSRPLRDVFVHRLMVNKGGGTPYFPGISVLCNTGEVGPVGEPIDDCMTFGLWGDTLEQSFSAAGAACMSGGLNAEETRGCEIALRIYLGIAMLHDNPDFVEAVVLRKDAAKYAETRDPKYVEKAKRRGEYGWNVGANIEVLPHFRRPHFAIRWTGKGSEVPKLVPVKGCVVKRNRFTEVPTGYQVDEEAGELASSA